MKKIYFFHCVLFLFSGGRGLKYVNILYENSIFKRSKKKCLCFFVFVFMRGGGGVVFVFMRGGGGVAGGGD